MVTVFIFWKPEVVPEDVYTEAINNRITYISQLLYT